MISEVLTVAAVAANSIDVIKGLRRGVEVSGQIKSGKEVEYGFDDFHNSFMDLGAVDFLNVFTLGCWGVRVGPELAKNISEGYSYMMKMVDSNPELLCIVVPTILAVGAGMITLTQVPELAIVAPLKASVNFRAALRAGSENAGKLIADKIGRSGS